MQHKIPDYKVCPNCLENKHSSLYHRNAARRDGLTYVCSDCIPEYEAKEKKSKKNLADIEKTCEKCNRLLNSRMFLYDQNTEDRLRNSCRTCYAYRLNGNPSDEEIVKYESTVSGFIAEGLSIYDIEKNRSEFEQFIWKKLLSSGLLVQWRPPVWIHKTSIPE